MQADKRAKEEKFAEMSREIYAHMREQLAEQERQRREQEQIDQDLLKQRIIQDQKVPSVCVCVLSEGVTVWTPNHSRLGLVYSSQQEHPASAISAIEQISYNMYENILLTQQYTRYDPPPHTLPPPHTHTLPPPPTPTH